MRGGAWSREVLHSKGIEVPGERGALLVRFAVLLRYGLPLLVLAGLSAFINNHIGENLLAAGENSTDAREKLAVKILRTWDGCHLLGNPAPSAASANPNSTDQSADTTLSAQGSPLVPKPPHLEDCDYYAELQERFDRRQGDGSLPKWAIWHRVGDPSSLNQEVPNSREDLPPMPPWISGSDEDNLPLTRQAQRDVWLNQHPKDCSSPDVRFIVVNLTNEPNLPYLGVGAELRVLAGYLSSAMKQNRVLVVHYWWRADHDGCQGDNWAKLSCYFAPETTQECRERALSLLPAARPDAERDPNSPIHFGVAMFQDTSPDRWGTPWDQTQTSMDVHGQLISKTGLDNHRWFRAQAFRYLLRYPSPRLCHLTNKARHEAFGQEAALAVADALTELGANSSMEADARQPGIEGGGPAPDSADGSIDSAMVEPPLEPLWRRSRPFMGQGLIVSMHVRQGDKAEEMVMHPFSDYMDLAQKLRSRFPDATRIWLSTEMDSVVRDSAKYKSWTFYFTKVPRQGDIERMFQYEGNIGMRISTDNAYVNLRIAVSCDYFIGTMGSTWSLIIDDLRRTSGKESRGMLSVNKDRFWV